MIWIGRGIGTTGIWGALAASIFIVSGMGNDYALVAVALVSMFGFMLGVFGTFFIWKK